MPIFAPFSYLANPIVPPAPAWDPSDFTNVQYWWRADLGVTTTGTGVSQWRDQINNFDMIQGTDGSRPSATTSSNLNGADVLSFNGSSDYMYTATTPAALSSSDATILAVWDMVSANNGAVMGVPTTLNGTRFWMDTLNGNYRIFGENIYSGGGSAYTVESPASTGANAMKMRYDASAGDGFVAQNTLTETTIGTAGDVNTTWRASSTVAVGALVSGIGGGVFLSRYVEYKLAEQVFVYGTPTTNEMDEWKTYVNNRYGTIIS
jgi:hypothetical protein